MHKEADAMQEYLNIPATLDDPAALTTRLQKLDVYLARLSDIITRARAMKDYAQNLYLTENEDKLTKLSATVSNRIIKTFLYEFNVTVDRLELLYSTMSHISKDLVTQISYIKQQMLLK